MISFFKQDIVFNLVEQKRYRKWVNKLAFSQNQCLFDLTFIFCSDAYLLDLNRRFLGHDFCTDVISFDHSSLYSNEKISGDIYISIETVAVNAQDYGSSFEDELLRVMAHGLLHLIGFNDINEEERLLMQQQEDIAISLFKELV